MGWCSGTEVFDRMVEFILKANHPEDEKVAVIVEIINALEWQDWDCQRDSVFYNNPVVQSAFRKVHPDCFNEIGEE